MISSIKHLYKFRRNISFMGLFNSLRFYKRIKKISEVEILYACHDNSRPILLNGKYYSPLIDSIILKLNNYSNISLALPFSKYSDNKTPGNTINLNLYVIIALLKRFITSGSISLKKINKDPLIKFYKKLFEKLNLKLIIAIQPSMEICIAARQIGLKVMDVQHGIIEIDDSSSYYSLDKRLLHKNFGWPDYILCRNKQSYNKVLKLKNYTKPILIGNLNKFFYENVYYNNKEKQLFEKKTKTILFTFQPMYNDSAFSKNNICEGIIFPKKLHELILKNEYNFILKLHPSQIQKKNLYKSHINAFDKLFSDCKNVDYKICNKKPLEYSLTKSDLHITFNSASVFDASDYGLKTVLLDDNHNRLNNYFGELIESGNLIVDPNLEINLSEHFSKTKQNIINKDLNDFGFKDFIFQNLR